jgi:hypothetical protein
MTFALPTLDEWDQLDGAEQEEIARRLATWLPSPFRYVEVKRYALGSQEHSVAFFDWTGALFALIPGGEVTLGYDPSQPFIPDSVQLRSWREFADRWLGEQDHDLQAYLVTFLTPIRQVTMQPFLLEVTSRALDAEYNLRGPTPSLLEDAPTFATADALVRSEGFRLPTSDEWEYACAAGSRTLWRWGDWYPPIDMPSPDDEQPRWTKHLQPNAFGLTIARWPYDWEFCATVGRMRGGDGGTALHGGAGHFIEWLTLVSALEVRWSEDPTAKVYGAYVRRALTI